MSKRNPYTFTLMFNPDDPLQVKAVEIINRQRRSKSSFIASSVVHYVDCNQVPTSSLLQEQQLEAIVERVIKRCIAELGSQIVPAGKQMPEAAHVLPHTLPATPQDEPLSADDQYMLLDGLDAFRKKQTT